MIGQKIYVGCDSLSHLSDLLKTFGSKHVLIVRGKKSYESCGAQGLIGKILFDNSCISYEYQDFEENPKIEDVQAGLSIIENNPVDTILAVGGGSVMDMAKLIRFSHSYEGDLTGKSFEKKNALIKLIAIPTTAGTGSEVTQFAVAYKDKIKYSLDHEDVLPDVAMVYPPFTYNNPMYLTACTGFDALAQAIESFWSVKADAESLNYATLAIRKLWNSLPQLVESPTEKLREMVSEGAYWAGRAIGVTRTTAAHALSYSLTSHYGYPHGHAVALVFPAIFNLNVYALDYLSPLLDKDEYSHRIDSLFELLGVDKENGSRLIADYISNLGLGLKENMPSGYETAILISGVNLSRLGNNPIVLDTIKVTEIFEPFNTQFQSDRVT